MASFEKHKNKSMARKEEEEEGTGAAADGWRTDSFDLLFFRDLD